MALFFLSSESLEHVVSVRASRLFIHCWSSHGSGGVLLEFFRRVVFGVFLLISYEDNNYYYYSRPRVHDY